MKNIRFYSSENFPFLVEKCSIYLNRRVFVMRHVLTLKTVCETGCMSNSSAASRFVKHAEQGLYIVHKTRISG